MPTRHRAVLAGLAALLAVPAIVVVSATPAAADTSCDAVDIETTDDACGSTAAVSVTGDASTSSTGDCGRAHSGPAAGCISVSGTGDATNDTGGDCGYSFQGVGVGCVAVSGTGDASNDVDRSCGTSETGVAVGCVAVAPHGKASNRIGWTYANTYTCGGSSGLPLGAGHPSFPSTARAVPSVPLGCAAVGGDGADNPSLSRCRGQTNCQAVRVCGSSCASFGQYDEKMDSSYRWQYDGQWARVGLQFPEVRRGSASSGVPFFVVHYEESRHDFYGEYYTLSASFVGSRVSYHRSDFGEMWGASVAGAHFQQRVADGECSQRLSSRPGPLDLLPDLEWPCLVQLPAPPSPRDEGVEMPDGP